MDITLAPEPSDSDDPYGPDSGVAALARFCERSGLPLPPLPEAFIPLLQEVGEGVFSSRTDLPTLTEFDPLVAEAAAGEGRPVRGAEPRRVRRQLVVPALHRVTASGVVVRHPPVRRPVPGRRRATAA